VIRVPQGCPTVEKAMALAVVFSERKVYTGADPLKVEMDEGVHEITDGNYVPDNEDKAEDDEEWEEDDGSHDKTMLVPCSHITFVGKGKDQTTIRGGFAVRNQQNVKFEEMTVTNPSGSGLEFFGSETNACMLKCIVKECRFTGLAFERGATGTATQCEFMNNGVLGVLCQDANTKARLNDCKMHHNGSDGLCAHDDAVVDLHGTRTNIHSNKVHGILADKHGKINIHLPSEHNTSHDNVGGGRHQGRGGSIANINADGTFTHAVVDEDDY